MSSDRLQEWVKSVPLVTVGLFALNSAIHALVFLFTIPLGEYAISPARVLIQHEVYRLFTSSFVHGGILHIGMNMMSLLQLGPAVESQFGSMKFLFLTVWTVVLTNCLYVFISWSMSYMTANPGYMYQNAVGYSGVLFTYALVDCYHTTATTRSLFGILNVPSRLYPWIILLCIQIVLPNISFIGHLCGILVGLMAVYGLLGCILPSHETCVRLERGRLCSPVHAQSNYVGSVDISFVASSGSGGSILESIVGSMKWILGMVWNIIATLLHIIGCPVEACTSYASSRYASFVNYMNTPRSSPPPPTVSATQTAGDAGRESVGRRLGGGGSGGVTGGRGGAGRGSTTRSGGNMYTAVDQAEGNDDQASTAIEV